MPVHLPQARSIFRFVDNRLYYVLYLRETQLLYFTIEFIPHIAMLIAMDMLIAMLTSSVLITLLFSVVAALIIDMLMLMDMGMLVLISFRFSRFTRSLSRLL